MKKQDKVSVIMPCYEEPKPQLRQAISSILNQSHQNLELIIILDNPENEGLEKLIQEFCKKDKRIIFVKNKENLGRWASRNVWIQKAKWKYIAILDADDISLKDRLKQQIEYFNNNPWTDLLFTWATFIDEDWKKIKEFRPNKYFFYNIKKYIFQHHITVHPSMMVKTEIMKELKYDPNFVRSQDYEFWLRALGKWYNFELLEKPLIKYRTYTFTYEKRIQKEIMFSKYTFLAHIKNLRFFLSNFFYIKRMIIAFCMYVTLSLTPDSILTKYLKYKDAK